MRTTQLPLINVTTAAPKQSEAEKWASYMFATIFAVGVYSIYVAGFMLWMGSVHAKFLQVPAYGYFDIWGIGQPLWWFMSWRMARQIWPN